MSDPNNTNGTDLPQGWLSESLTKAEHEVGRWSPALRDSLESAMGEPLPTPSPAGAREEITRAIYSNLKAKVEHNATTGVPDIVLEIGASVDAVLALFTSAPGETEATLRAEVERRFWRARALAAEAERDEARRERDRMAEQLADQSRETIAADERCDRLTEEKRVLREALKQAAVRLEVTASIVTMTHKNSARLEMWASEARFALNQESPNGNP